GRVLPGGKRAADRRDSRLPRRSGDDLFDRWRPPDGDLHGRWPGRLDRPRDHRDVDHRRRAGGRRLFGTPRLDQYGGNPRSRHQLDARRGLGHLRLARRHLRSDRRHRRLHRLPAVDRLHPRVARLLDPRMSDLRHGDAERLMRRPRLTYANVVATICLFLVLGGGAWAATSLPKNSVGTKQLKNGAVTGAKVKKGALTGADIRASTLGRVPQAASAETAA